MTDHLARLIERYPILSVCRNDIQAAVELLTALYRSGNKLLVCGNGGSASDSEHIVGELMKGFLKRRPISKADADRLVSVGGTLGTEVAKHLQGALPAVALTSPVAITTAVINDMHGDLVYAQQVHGLGNVNDALLGISTSGNARNVINACVVARARSMRTIILTGRTGGELLAQADVAIRVPADAVYEIQELHLPVYHAICMALEETFFS